MARSGQVAWQVSAFRVARFRTSKERPPRSGSDIQRTSATEWRQGWPVVLAAVLGTITVALHLISLGPLMHLIQADTGWTRQQVVMGTSIVSLVSAGLLPFGGMLADRFGVRLVAAPVLVLYGAGGFAFFFSRPYIPALVFCWVF